MFFIGWLGLVLLIVGVVVGTSERHPHHHRRPKSSVSFKVSFQIHLPVKPNISQTCLDGAQKSTGQKEQDTKRSLRKLLRQSFTQHTETPQSNLDNVNATARNKNSFPAPFIRPDAERAAAVQAVRRIIHETQSLWKNLTTTYTSKDIMVSVYALAQIQEAVKRTERNQEQVEQTEERVLSTAIDTKLLEELAYYSVFANAAYGWKLELAWNRRIRFGDFQTLLAHTNLSSEDIVACKWISSTHRPGYFIARDRQKKAIVLCVRGTWSAHDVLSDLCCQPEELTLPLRTIDKLKGVSSRIRAHHGMLQAAMLLKEDVENMLLQELLKNPGFELVLVGHSMGGGLCALLGMLLKETVRAPMAVYVYGAPAVVAFDDWQTTLNANIVSVVMDCDFFSRLSIGHLKDIGSAVTKLCEDRDLRERIMLACRKTAGQNMTPESTQWCQTTYSHLKKCMTSNKLVPPGRILRLSKNQSGRRVTTFSIKQEKAARFLDLPIRRDMFDLKSHAPATYVSALHHLVQIANHSQGDRS